MLSFDGLVQVWGLIFHLWWSGLEVCRRLSNLDCFSWLTRRAPFSHAKMFLPFYSNLERFLMGNNFVLPVSLDINWDVVGKLTQKLSYLLLVFKVSYIFACISFVRLFNSAFSDFRDKFSTSISCFYPIKIIRWVCENTTKVVIAYLFKKIWDVLVGFVKLEFSLIQIWF